MEEVLSGVKRLFWNPQEARLRALFRLPAAFVVGLLAGNLLFVLARLLPLSARVRTVTLLVVGLLSILGIAWFVDRRYLSDLGYGIDGAWLVDGLAGLTTGAAMVGVAVAVLSLLGMGTVGAGTFASSETGGTLPELAYAFVFFLGGAALEETIFRGYLLTNVAEGTGSYFGQTRAVLVAVALTAMLFGLLHAGNPGGSPLSVLNVSLAGVVLGGAYVLTEGLAFPIGLHAAWNFGLGPVFGFPVSGATTGPSLVALRTDGPSLVTGGGFGPEGGLVMLPALAAGGGLLAWWATTRHDGIVPSGAIAVPDLRVDDRTDS